MASGGIMVGRVIGDAGKVVRPSQLIRSVRRLAGETLMQCDKCGSTVMVPKKLFRSSGCLVVVGAVLLLTSLAATVLGVVVGLVGPGATRDAVSARDSQATAKAVAALHRIPDLPAGVVRELESSGRVAEETLSQLPLEQRQRVRSILIDYYGARVGTGVAHGVTGGIGTFFVLVLLAFGIPGVIIGLLLLRRRKVWRCSSCGFAFDRT